MSENKEFEGQAEQGQGQEQSIVVASSGESQVQTVVDMFTGRSLQVFSSISGQDMDSKLKVYNAMNDNEGNIADHIGEVFTITDIVAYPVKFYGEDGEEVQTVRVVLIDEDGKSWGTVANGIRSSIQNLMGVVGQAPWHPGIKVSPVQKKTRNGFKTVVLRLVP